MRSQSTLEIRKPSQSPNTPCRDAGRRSAASHAAVPCRRRLAASSNVCRELPLTVRRPVRRPATTPRATFAIESNLSTRNRHNRCATGTFAARGLLPLCQYATGISAASAFDLGRDPACAGRTVSWSSRGRRTQLRGVTLRAGPGLLELRVQTQVEYRSRLWDPRARALGSRAVELDRQESRFARR